jgi:hypothetical protein
MKQTNWKGCIGQLRTKQTAASGSKRRWPAAGRSRGERAFSPTQLRVPVVTPAASRPGRKHNQHVDFELGLYSFGWCTPLHCWGLAHCTQISESSAAGVCWQGGHTDSAPGTERTLQPHQDIHCTAAIASETRQTHSVHTTFELDHCQVTRRQSVQCGRPTTQKGEKYCHCSTVRDMPTPLDGLRVVELEGIGPAPLGCCILADFGASVVTVTRVVKGEHTLLHHWMTLTTTTHYTSSCHATATTTAALSHRSCHGALPPP